MPRRPAAWPRRSSRSGRRWASRSSSSSTTWGWSCPSPTGSRCSTSAGGSPTGHRPTCSPTPRSSGPTSAPVTKPVPPTRPRPPRPASPPTPPGRTRDPVPVAAAQRHLARRHLRTHRARLRDHLQGQRGRQLHPGLAAAPRRIRHRPAVRADRVLPRRPRGDRGHRRRCVPHRAADHQPAARRARDQPGDRHHRRRHHPADRADSADRLGHPQRPPPVGRGGLPDRRRGHQPEPADRDHRGGGGGGGGSFRIGDVGISQNRLIATIVAGVLIALFFAAFKYSSWGVSMRAAAEDGETAALMGIRLGRVSALAWTVAGALAAVAALFLVGAPTPGVTPPASPVALRAFPAAILGGLDSTGGALVGGLLIGLAESFAAGYQDQLLFLGRGFGDVVPYIVMIAVLLVRPSGLFGTKELTRV